MKHASEEVVQMLLDAYADGCKVADNDGNLPLHVAIEYEASDAVIALLIAKHSGACRELNHIKKLPMDLALEHGASEAVVSEIAAGEKVARDAEVGILAWLWG
jgi:ankyrin repeat protein